MRPFFTSSCKRAETTSPEPRRNSAALPVVFLPRSRVLGREVEVCSTGAIQQSIPKSSQNNLTGNTLIRVDARANRIVIYVEA